MSNNPGILIIEDEKPIRTFLRASLQDKGYNFMEAETGNEGLAMAASHTPDIIILDLGLPDMDGMDVIMKIRAWSSVPIIIVSARSQEKEKVAALDAGADDYLTKPFSMEELKARIRVALRQHRKLSGEGRDETVFIVRDLKIDSAARKVFVKNSEIHLTPIEYKILTTLTGYAGRVLTHRQLIKEVWGLAHEDQTQKLRVFMAGLRKKIESDPANPKYLLTEQGVGYRFSAD